MNKNHPIIPNMLRICIDKKENMQIKGRVYSPLTTKPFVFQDFHELILGADRIFNQTGYPQAFQDKRSFLAEENFDREFCIQPEILCPPEVLLHQFGLISTYEIAVLSRTKTNWQGYITDSDGVLLASFDDIMQIIPYIQ